MTLNFKGSQSNLKLIKLEGDKVTLNQGLEGHTSPVVKATWNSKYKKLTTADANGLIIVWVLGGGGWYVIV